MSADVEIRNTGDGSPTLYSKSYDQTYHNPGGAVAESKHVFFEYSGLRQQLEEGDPLTILETGFGTGLNLLLFLDYWLEYGHRQSIHFYSIEADPISSDLARSMQYQEYLKHDKVIESIVPDILKECEPGFNSYEPIENANISLFIGSFHNYPPNHLEADYIFHDAFSPDVNPELWTGETFKHLLSNSAESAILTTYCAASRARGALSWSGWTVAEAPGALGKREMTVASPSREKLEKMDLKLINNERLAHRYEIGDFD